MSSTPALKSETLVKTESPAETLVEEPTINRGQKKDLAFYMVFLSLCITTFLSALDLTSVSVSHKHLCVVIKSSQRVEHSSDHRSRTEHQRIHLDRLKLCTFIHCIPAPLWLTGVNFWSPTYPSRINHTLHGRICYDCSCQLARAHYCWSNYSGHWCKLAHLSYLCILISLSLQGGGILALVEIIVADMVALHERGVFMGFIGMVWALASAIGPLAGGAFAQSNWRWLFWINLPIGKP